MRREDLTKAMRWHIADRLAEDRLDAINATLEDVKVKDTFYTRFGKRFLDIVLSGAAIIVTAPINLVLAVITYFDVGKPILFRQDRLGKDGKLFQIIKFRNMRNTVDERGELLPADQRVTRFGKFVRKTSLDELLNFYSVFKGDMSIIGPRPLLPEHKGRFHKRHIMRLALRPGLECPPREGLDHVWTWNEQFDNDVWYVENVSFRTDCHMLMQLVRFVFNKKSSNARAMSTRGIFSGYDFDGRAITLDEVPQSYIDECENML